MGTGKNRKLLKPLLALYFFLWTCELDLLQCRPCSTKEKLPWTWSGFLRQDQDIFNDVNPNSADVEPIISELKKEYTIPEVNPDLQALQFHSTFTAPLFHPEVCGTTPAISTIHPRIIGGVDTAPGQIPWQAGLVLIQEGGRGSRITCGGTIITRTMVLTAAHCLSFPPASYQVWVGRDSSNLAVEELHQQKLRVVDYVNHPQFVPAIFKNDIALVSVASQHKQGFILNDWVLPACLMSSTSYDMYKEGKVGTTSGWGLLKEGANHELVTLQNVDVLVLSHGYCKDAFSFLSSFSDATQFCAGVLEGGKDSCSGDSGGPLTVKEEVTGRQYVSGVVSFGVGCGRGHYPGVYTKVDTFLSWIVQEIEALNWDSGDYLKYNDLLNDEKEVMFVEMMAPFENPITHLKPPVCSATIQAVKCDLTSTVKIVEGFFGRDNVLDCPVPWLPSDGVFTCSLPSALSDLQRYCDGKRFCTINTWTREDEGPFITNPCLLQEPFVKLGFICIEDNSEVTKLDNNINNKRHVGFNMNFNEQAEMKSKLVEQPDKRSSAWHSKGWQDSESVDDGMGGVVNYNRDGHRIRYLL